MSYPKLVGMVQKIAQATSIGVVQWKETEIEDVFQISFSDNSVRIGERSSRSDPAFSEFYLSIFNIDGEIVEDIGDEDGNNQEERGVLYRALKDTYETARRQAKGVDQVLDSILSELNIKMPF